MTLTPRFPHFLHGGDYNPDQWLSRPDILEQDVQLMTKAGVNAVSLGIFSWAALEPEEDHFSFSWLDQIIERLWQSGIHVILATPSGARPAWLAQKYPEVLRVGEDFTRNHFGGRHNHCPTSPVYRQKVQKIDTLLAQRYANHPSVILWHISNEFSGDCRCPLCQARFRAFLQERYGTLDELNRAWCTGFWSMSYSDWSQIEPPSPRGQMSNLSLLLDWRRFSTKQCKDFIAFEKATVQAVCPDIPCTTNLMERFWDYDYFDLAEVLDLVSWDSYPAWTGKDDEKVACEFAMNHDMMRSLKDQPFLMMESTPSNVNWKAVNKLKRPGAHLLSSMQAVAHGSQSVLYFQWRQSRGNAEMFHGAVVSHSGRDDTRVFQDVAQVGHVLKSLDSVLYPQQVQKSEICILYDWNCRWAVEYAQTGLNGQMDYHGRAMAHYHSLWRLGLPVDFRDMRKQTDFSRYRLIICPQTYLFMNDIEKKLREFVGNGGVLVITYFSGIADATNLAFLSDAPHDLTDVFGLRETEMDALYPDEENQIRMEDGSLYKAYGICSLLAPEGCSVKGVYTKDFYAGTPAIASHVYQSGEAWYIGARLDQTSLDDFYAKLTGKLQLTRAINALLPHGVTAHRRGDTVFIENYSGLPASIDLPGTWSDLITHAEVQHLDLEPFQVRILHPET